MTHVHRFSVVAVLLLAGASLGASSARAEGSGLEPGLGEGGLYWGLFLPSSDHELFDADDPSVVPEELESVTPELGPDTLEAWDSLNHLNICTAVSQEFGVELTTAQMLAIKNVGDLSALCEPRGRSSEPVNPATPR